LQLSSSSTTTSRVEKEGAAELDISIWESIARRFFAKDLNNIEQREAYTNTVSLLRLGIPSLAFAASSKIAYPYISIELANEINDSGIFAVVSQDASQYIQNILTTSGLTFSILLGQTYYFMYQVRTIENANYLLIPGTFR
jgi:hypothetical protein